MDCFKGPSSPSTRSACLSLKFTIYHSAQFQVPRAAGLSFFGRTLTLLAPRRAVLHDPIEQRPFKPNIVPNLFALNPLVAKDFFSFGQKLLVQSRILYQFRGIILRRLGLPFLTTECVEQGVPEAIH